MTATNKVATREEVADVFGVDDTDEIADDLYDDYLAYVASVCPVCGAAGTWPHAPEGRRDG